MSSKNIENLKEKMIINCEATNYKGLEIKKTIIFFKRTKKIDIKKISNQIKQIYDYDNIIIKSIEFAD